MFLPCVRKFHFRTGKHFGSYIILLCQSIFDIVYSIKVTSTRVYFNIDMCLSDKNNCYLMNTIIKIIIMLYT